MLDLTKIGLYARFHAVTYRGTQILIKDVESARNLAETAWQRPCFNTSFCCMAPNKGTDQASPDREAAL